MLHCIVLYSWTCGCTDVTFFAEVLGIFDRQHKMLLQIMEKRPLGLLLVDASKLKESLIPSPLKCINVRSSKTCYNNNNN